MQAIDTTVVIGGEAGQGIQTIGQLLASACHDAGFYVFAVNDFESRIRGGHSFFRLRISDRPVQAPVERAHLLVALDENTIEVHRDHLAADGLILAEKEISGQSLPLVSVPFTDLARDAGGRILANSVAAGACLALLGGGLENLERSVAGLFSTKSAQIVEQNQHAGRLGFENVSTVRFPYAFQWSRGFHPKGVLMEGAKAVALGALAGDCRFGAFYPMSPATGIMAHLTQLATDLPVVVEQAEDEIAAINMIIGASFAGVRTMTATSGGGFSLMTEGVGLAAITETPIVVVNAQRPGPATGLPTRTAQGDLLFMINASQDEFPRFVFAPATPAEAFELTARAFDLADKYQVPAMVLVDQFFADSLFVEETPLRIPQSVSHYTVTDEQIDDPDGYNRFALTPDGVSPRALPCAGRALVMVCSDEHDPRGHMDEERENRIAMVDKRQAKLPAMLAEMRPPVIRDDNSSFFLVGWGSTKGAIDEAVGLLRDKGKAAGSIHFSDIWPFPADTFIKAVAGGRRFYLIEQNHNAQLGQLIRQQTGLEAAGAVLTYDGRPLCAGQILDGLDSQWN